MRGDTEYFSVKMKFQLVYETNCEYFQTYSMLRVTSNIIVEPTKKGLLEVFFKGLKSKALISNKGTVQVFYNSEKEKEIVEPLLKRSLIPRKGQLKWDPKKITLFSIQWPPDPNLKLSACKEVYRYKLQPLVQKLSFRRGPHPFLWGLFFTVLSFPVWLQILLRLLG